MPNVSYILNLSSSYNAGNFMYYFLPGISSGKILLFDKLTKKQFSANKKTQLAELTEMLWNLKNHWDFYKLNPNNDSFSLKINVVIDSNPWDFTGFGDYSRFPYVKIYFIKLLLKDLLSEQELSQIKFQYFVLKNEAFDIEETVHFIDEHKGILQNEESVSFGTIDTTLISWPNCNDFKAIIAKEFDVKTLNVADKITGKLAAAFETDLASMASIIKSKMTKDSDTKKYKTFIDNRIVYFYKLFHKEITTIRDLNNSAKKKAVLKEFFKTFSSINYLKHNKDFLFRFSINLNNTNSKIVGFERLTALLVESVNFFEAKKPIHFLTLGDDDITLNVSNMTFDENAKNKLFSKYLAYSENSISIDRVYDAKKKLKYFNNSTQIDPTVAFNVDDKIIYKFISVNSWGKKIKVFFYDSLVKQAKLAFAENSIAEIEDYIQIQSGKVNEALHLDGYFGMGEGIKDISFKQAEQELNKLKKEEKISKNQSHVDYETYREFKEQYEEDIVILEKDYVNSLSLLPTKIKTLLFGIVSLILIFLYFAPIYTFEFWIFSISITILYTGLMFLAAIATWYYLRAKIKARFKAIELKNHALYWEFDKYVTSLKELAISIKESSLRRKNIEELQRVYNDFKEEENQILLYKDFYSNIVKQLRKNAYILKASNEAVKEANYQIAPYLDSRIANKHAMVRFSIHNRGSKKTYPEENTSFHSVLGVINSIEFNKDLLV